ncbi:MAG: diacylglycerol kinase family protein [Bacteroidia bacterium]
MKKKIYFIVNPISGVGRQKVIEGLIDKYLDRTLYDYEIAYTKAAKHATELSQKAANSGFDIVVAVGGDGSVNEVARGLIGTQSVLAIIPAGSGNGLARHLQIPIHLKSAMDIINKGIYTTIDTMLLNDEPFVNIGGVGFDAHIGWEFAKFGKRGFVSYLKVIQREFPKYKPQEFEFTIDGKKENKKAYLISFANGSQWGNNAIIAPLADVSDGLMDLVVLKDVSLLKSISIGYRLFRKTIHKSAHVEIYKTKEAVINQQHSIAHIDGEPIKTGQTIRVKVNPLSLRVLVP